MSAVVDSTLGQTLTPAKPKRSPVPYTLGWVLALVVGDLAMFVVAAALAAHLVFPARGFRDSSPVIASTITVILIWFAIFARVGLYHRSFALSVRDEFYVTVGALCLGVAPQLILFTIVPTISTSRLVLLLSLVFSVAFVGGSRALAHAMRDAVSRRRPRRIVVVGAPQRIEQAAESLNIVEGTEVLTLQADGIDEEFANNDAASQELDHVAWFQRAMAWNADTLILTEMLPPSAMPSMLDVAARYHIDIAFAPPRLRSQAYTLSLRTDGHQALIVATPLAACTPPSRLLKRLTDLVLAVLALVIAAPVMALAALAILLEDGRPILFRQARVGRNGVVFNLLKFRSMAVDAEQASGPVWSVQADPRATRVGKVLRRLSIDELPQLLNVLRGDMSIVGPRPERPEFVEQFRQALPRYDDRHLVRPGITGWSQVHMARVLAPSQAAEKLSFDLFYVEHWSPFLDVYVLVKTVAEFLFHRV
jgi:exopolysaccharide biosynthesis polyprenyl glycosylphosphotransferase